LWSDRAIRQAVQGACRGDCSGRAGRCRPAGAGNPRSSESVTPCETNSPLLYVGHGDVDAERLPRRDDHAIARQRRMYARLLLVVVIIGGGFLLIWVPLRRPRLLTPHGLRLGMA